LRIHIHKQNTLAQEGDTSGKIHGRRGLSYATFLICDRYDLCHI
jgi:hypothetical protein